MDGQTNAILTKLCKVILRIAHQDRKDAGGRSGSRAVVTVADSRVDLSTQSTALRVFQYGKEPAQQIGGLCGLRVKAHRNLLMGSLFKQAMPARQNTFAKDRKSTRLNSSH